MFIKNGTVWKALDDAFVQISGYWKQVQYGFIAVLENGVMKWKQFFGENAPVVVTKPSIRTTNTSGSGTIYDGPVASSPQTLNTDLFGKDGTYTNYTSISGRKFTYALTDTASTRTTLINDDRFTSAGGVTTAMRSTVDDQYLFYELNVSNSTDTITPVSNPIKMIKDYPNVNSFGWSQAEQVGTQLAFNYNLSNYYYNSVETGSSYIRWWRSNSTNPSGTLIKQETISATTTSSSSSSLSGTSYYTPTSSDIGYYVVAQIIAVSSYTRYNGYTDNYSLASYPTSNPLTSPLVFSNVLVKDYNFNNGLDNRGGWPTGTINRYSATLNGYDSSTVIRIRYRIYNSSNTTYYKPSTSAASTATASWDTWTSNGTGDGSISSVTINGSTVTLYDNVFLDSTVFNGGGSYPGNWELHVELSAIKTGGTRVYYLNPYDTYYISKRVDASVSRSPSGTVSPNTNVTISGSFVGYPATPSTNAYPRQYRVNYGDNSNSGWLPVGEYAFNTPNPTFNLTKQYASSGTYTVTLEAIPFGTNATTTVTVANVLTTPTITSVTGSAGNINVAFTGGSGPYYQVYWYSIDRSDIQSVSAYDAYGSSSPVNVTNLVAPTAGQTYYFWIRSSSTQTGTGTGPSTSFSSWSSSVSWTAPVLAPTNATLPTLSPTSISVGTVLSAGIGTWNNSPTSYDIRIYRGTANVATFETLVASRTGSSTANLTYTVTQADYDSGQRYFRTFVDASNSGGSSGLIAGQERGPIATPVSKPSGGTISLSGTAQVGQTITATTSGWSGSPTSYDTRIVRGTQFVIIGETLKASSTTNSVSYTIQSADVGYYFKGFAYATNSAGTSDSYASSNEIGPVTQAVSLPGTPTSVSCSSSGSVSWGAPTSGGTPTSYEIEFYTASNGTGSNAAGPYSVTGISSSPYQLTSPYGGTNANWARVRVRARNSAGAGSYSGWYPSSTTYV